MLGAMKNAKPSPQEVPSKMRAVEVSQPGGPDVLSVSPNVDVPRPREREILIRVKAAGVNRPDLMQRAGKYPPPPGASPRLGLEVAGVVAATGPGSRWRVGQEVCALTPGGGYAEFCLAPDEQVIELPRGITMIEAAGLPETYFTVWANVFQIAQLQAGERLLVHGGTSGIGTTAIQLAKALGAEVFATAGTDEKCRACEKLGAKRAINYKTEDFVTAIEGGVDVVLDMIGGSYTPRNLEVLRTGGRLVQIATQESAQVTINLMKIMQKRLRVMGSTLRPRSVEDKGRIATELRERVWPLLEQRRVGVIVDRIFKVEDVAEAHRYLEAGAHVGKIVLSFE